MTLNTDHMEMASHQCEGFSSVCVLLWIFISLFCENDFGHWSHEKYFSPLWVFLWLLKCLACVNDFGHWSHGKGFSPFWFLLWILKWLFRKNDFEHWSQGNVLFIFLSYQSKLKAFRNGIKDLLYTSTRFLIKFSCIATKDFNYHQLLPQLSWGNNSNLSRAKLNLTPGQEGAICS